MLPIFNEVNEENWARFRSVPIRRNSVFGGFRQSLFWFIQDRMSLNEDVKMLTVQKRIRCKGDVELSVINIKVVAKEFF